MEPLEPPLDPLLIVSTEISMHSPLAAAFYLFMHFIAGTSTFTH